MLYFTADLHFYHENIIRHANRPYYNIEKMNDDLIKRWNKIHISGKMPLQKQIFTEFC